MGSGGERSDDLDRIDSLLNKVDVWRYEVSSDFFLCSILRMQRAQTASSYFEVTHHVL